jgi:hypothetical protein
MNRIKVMNHVFIQMFQSITNKLAVNIDEFRSYRKNLVTKP